VKRKVRNLIRLLASGLFVAGAMTLGLEMMGQRVPGSGIRASYLLAGAILILMGAFLFGASNKLAEHFMDDFDED
jgi:hypothetical protein